LTKFASQRGRVTPTKKRLAFEQGWRAEYDLSKRWELGVGIFGEIEDLANAGSFNDQVHGIGPTLFTNFGGNDDEAKGRDDDEHQVKAGDDNERADRHQWRSR
jgi:hypothetical protein